MFNLFKGCHNHFNNSKYLELNYRSSVRSLSAYIALYFLLLLLTISCEKQKTDFAPAPAPEAPAPAPASTLDSKRNLKITDIKGEEFLLTNVCIDYTVISFMYRNDIECDGIRFKL
jgi:hypothetical protein